MISWLFCLLAAHAAPDTLSLGEALSHAREHNPNLEAARESIQQARIDRDRAWSLIQPMINVGGLYRVNDREIALDGLGGLDAVVEPFANNLGFVLEQLFLEGLISPEECAELAELNGLEECSDLLTGLAPPGDDTSAEPLVVQPRSQFFASAQLQWPLSPRVFPLLAAGRHRLAAADGQVRYAQDNLVLGVVQAYAGAYGAQETVVVLQDQVGLVDQHRDQVQVLVDAQVATRDVLTRATVEASRVRRQLAQAKVAAKSARWGLATVMGLDQPDFGPLEALPDLNITLGEQDLMDTALAQRGDLHAATATIDAVTALKTDASMRFLPQVALDASFRWSDTVAGFDTQRWNAYIGIGLNLPIWDGGQALQESRALSSQRRQAIAAEEGLQQQIRAEVARAHGEWGLAVEQLPLLRMELEAAKETLEIVSARYRAGAATQLEVLDARASVQGTALSLAQAKAQVTSAAAALLAATGTLERTLDR